MPHTSSETPFKTTYPEDVPHQVADEFLSQGAKFIDRHSVPKSMQDFDNIRRFVHENDDISYLANQKKHYQNGSSENVIHLIDAKPDGSVSGVGEVRFNPLSEDDYFKEKPFVGWTASEEEFRHEGLGRRRLLVMKLATSAEFGLALHSGTVHSDDNVIKIWERLVSEGKAVSYDQVIREGKTLRYKFTDKE